MKEVKTSKHRQTFPAVHSLQISGLGEHLDAEASKYGWCDIPEIGQIMRVHFQDLGAGEWSDLRYGKNEDIFDRYGFLNNMENLPSDQPLLTWMSFNNIELYGERPLADMSPYGLSVPAGWVKKILRLVNRGIVRVVLVKTPAPGIMLGDEQFCFRQLYGDVCNEGVITEKAYEISQVGGQLRLINTSTKKVTHISL